VIIANAVVFISLTSLSPGRLCGHGIEDAEHTGACCEPCLRWVLTAGTLTQPTKLFRAGDCFC
jgi:hypothetical protein